MIAVSNQNLSKPLICLGSVLGIITLISCVLLLSVEAIEVPFLLLALVAIKTGTRIIIKILYVSGQVTEDTGQILPIGRWALQEARRQLRRWQKRFPCDPALFISVNLSSKQFTQAHLIGQVKDILDETKPDPRSLKLEIPESVVMENIDTATGMLKQLRALRVQLSIGNFGTCYSSLSYLHRFPIDTLKVNRSFVMRMVDNNENIVIVRTILMLAQNLGMDVVAEGVETKEQLALLRKRVCENGQGYFFSRPVSVGGAEKIISDTYSHSEGSPNIQHNVRAIRHAMVA